MLDWHDRGLVNAIATKGAHCGSSPRVQTPEHHRFHRNGWLRLALDRLHRRPSDHGPMGMHRYLVKPFPSGALIEAIDKVG